MIEAEKRPNALQSHSRRKSGWQLSALYLLGLFAAIFFFHEVIPAGRKTFLGSWDSSVQSYAWHAANVEAVRSGTVGLWDFTSGSGTSFIGELQTAPLYPVTWLFALVPDPLNPDWLEFKILFHFALAFGSFVLLLQHNAVSTPAAICGALCFSFAGSVASRAPGQPNIFEGLVYLPLVVYLCQRAIEMKVRPWLNPWVGLAGLATAVMVVAGHVQPAVHAGLAVLLMVVMSVGRDFRALPARLLTLAAVGVVAGLLAAPQIAALLEYMSLAYRWIGAAQPTSPPHRIPYEVYGFDHVVAWSDFSSLWSSQQTAKDGATLFITKTGVFFLLLGLAAFRKSVARYALCLMAVAWFIAMGDGSWLGQAAYHVPLLGAIREPARTLCLFHLGACLLLGVGVDFLLQRIGRKSWVLWGGFALIAAGLVFELNGFTGRLILPRTMPMYPTTYYDEHWSTELRKLTREAPGGPYRFISLPNELLPPNLGNSSGALSARGHRATMQIGYRRFLDQNWDPAGPVFRRLGLRYVVSRDPVPGLSFVEEYGGLKLWERPDPVGVFHFTGPSGLSAAPIKHVSWHTNSVRVELDEHPATRFVFAQVMYPGWKVEVGDRAATLVDEQGLMAVDLPAGRSNVTFLYRPRWFLPLAVISAGLLLIVLGGAILLPKNE